MTSARQLQCSHTGKLRLQDCIVEVRESQGSGIQTAQARCVVSRVAR